MIDRPQKPPLCKGRWQKSLIFDGGIVPLQRFDFAGCKAQGQDTAAGRSMIAPTAINSRFGLRILSCIFKNPSIFTMGKEQIYEHP